MCEYNKKRSQTNRRVIDESSSNSEDSDDGGITDDFTIDHVLTHHSNLIFISAKEILTQKDKQSKGRRSSLKSPALSISRTGLPKRKVTFTVETKSSSSCASLIPVGYIEHVNVGSCETLPLSSNLPEHLDGWIFKKRSQETINDNASQVPFSQAIFQYNKAPSPIQYPKDLTEGIKTVVGNKTIYRRKYKYKKPLSIDDPQRKKLYRITIMKWKPGLQKIVCPECGANGRPIIKSHTRKIAHTTCAAACIASCLPGCFCPWLFQPSYVENLHCYECDHLLGSYDRKNAVVQPNKILFNSGSDENKCDIEKAEIKNQNYKKSPIHRKNLNEKNIKNCKKNQNTSTMQKDYKKFNIKEN